MKFQTRIKDIKLDDEIETYLQEKMDGLDHLLNSFGKSVSAEVELICKTEHHRKGQIYLAEVILYLPKKKVVAKSEADTILNAIDAVKSELQREINKYKEINIEKDRGAKK
jgi:ribosomal subunit interface protein